MKRYKRLPVPIEAWKDFNLKCLKINEDYKKQTGRKKTIPKTIILKAIFRKPIYFDNFEIIALGKRGRIV